MLLATPYQTLDISNITVHPHQKDKKEKTIAPLHYSQNGLTLHGLSILTPPLQVSSYDCSMNRLQLNLSNNRAFANKLVAIQDLLAELHPTIPLQRLCSGTILTLYLFPSTPLQNGQTIAHVKPDDTVRCVIRLHNLLLMDLKGPVHRLQHSVPIVFFSE
jgi:hypothetical protein